MLRDKSLVPLSRQHQHALALCVRIERASPIPESDVATWQQEMVQHFRTEIRVHFEAEEAIVFPAARAFGDLVPLVEELAGEHAWLREQFGRAEESSLGGAEILEFARKLSAHVRKEERSLFERLQELMNPGDLATMGQRLEEALKEAQQICIVPVKDRQP